MKYYNSTACQNIMSPQDLRYTSLTNYSCPDMPAQTKIHIQGQLALPIMGDDQQWWTMIVGTCSDLS